MNDLHEKKQLPSKNLSAVVTGLDICFKFTIRIPLWLPVIGEIAIIVVNNFVKRG